MADVFDLIEIYKNCLFTTFLNLRRLPTDSRAFADANAHSPTDVYQAITSRAALPWYQLHQPRWFSKLNTVIDPSVVATLIRSVFEGVGVYNLIYLQPQTADEN